MLKTRVFNVVMAGENTVTGIDINTDSVKLVQYTGKKQTLFFLSK